MTTLDNFRQYFNHLEIPTELSSLIRFQQEVSRQKYYSEGFELIVGDNEKSLLKEISQDKDFLDSIWEFAKADASGSTYAFWLASSNMNLGNAPIIVFGSEGGAHIVAKKY